MASAAMERRKAKGKCTRCKQQAPIGQGVCFDCAEKMAASKQAALAKGLCIRCWKEPRSEGKQHCGRCAQKRSLEDKQRKEKRKAAGLCVECGKAPQWEGRVMCAFCIRKRYGYS
jgi:hypothetical protein